MGQVTWTLSLSCILYPYWCLFVVTEVCHLWTCGSEVMLPPCLKGHSSVRYGSAMHTFGGNVDVMGSSDCIWTFDMGMSHECMCLIVEMDMSHKSKWYSWYRPYFYWYCMLRQVVSNGSYPIAKEWVKLVPVLGITTRQQSTVAICMWSEVLVLYRPVLICGGGI